MASHDGVEIGPQELRFRFQLNKQLLGAISINNTTDKRVAYKIKTTAPKKYVVRPSSGLLEPRSSVSVQVIMQAQKDYPDFQNCKDKFMVQSVVLDAGEELTNDTFNKEGAKKDALKEARLRVVLEGPAAPPSPVPEASEHDETASGAVASERDVHREATTSTQKAAQGDLSSSQEISSLSSLKSRLEKVTTERDKLQTQLDQIQLQKGSGASRATAAADPGLKFRVSMVHIILAAIIAFLVGHYL